MSDMIVTIDGPAGSGKSTAARLLAERLGFQFLDTGAMYRAVALESLSAGIDLDDEARVAEVARGLDIDALGPTVRANGRDVTAAIRARRFPGPHRASRPIRSCARRWSVCSGRRPPDTTS